MFGSQSPLSSGYLGVDGLNPQQMMAQQPPPTQQKRGMFGGGVSIDLGRALAGYLAGIGNPAGAQALQAMNEDRRQKQRQAEEQAQYEQRRQQSLQDQMSLYDYKAQFPDGEFAQELEQGGIKPGTPEWINAMQTKAQNALDPVVMTPQGPMLRSQVLAGQNVGQPAPQGVTFTPVDEGGPASQAPGGFPTSYSDIGPHHRY